MPRRAIAVTVALFALAAHADRDVPFRGLGDLPGGAFHSEALAISDNGRVIAGRSSSAESQEEGFVLTVDGLRPLLGPGGSHVAGEARAITPSGRIVAGKIASSNGPLEAARWTAETGWVPLGDLDGGGFGSQILGISSDGSVLVGWGTSALGLEAARWIDGRASAIGDLPGGPHHSAAALVSADGTTIVGTGHGARGPETFVWTEAAGFVGLGDLPGGAFSSEPFGMTADAAVIVGEATSANGIEAFHWTRADGMTGLGDLAGGAFSSIAFAVSSNGRVVVGTATTERGAEAFVWDPEHGMRALTDVLGITDWRLTEATGISADGKTIIGNGTNPSGQNEGWVARL